MIHYLLIVLLSCLAWQQEEPVLTWNAGDKIDWSDFKASPQRRADVIAVTASGLSFGYSTTRHPNGKIEYEFEVNAHFYPEKSWYWHDLVNSVTLDHERLHFDITELHARKFRKRIRQFRFTSNIDREMDELHSAIQTELREMQRLYDKETSHSRKVEKQSEWNVLIATELEKLNAYR